ncbi:hypothetical protein DPMN_121834 [Dreissena polymorpha]|uniref:Uncharacterized protein n=1 Tax=Dreissena polymorpha TaxID=45954 RepID=A0A9D4GN84_DREPO|nr:hypothetical protein DPMN_121834 [Dreissena polymorpha]
MVVVEPSHIPGLDLHTSRQPGYQATNRGRDASTRHEPYQEDRVLTPSRLRRPSKPWSDPSSPRREFGTQTGKVNASAPSPDGVYSTSLSLLLVKTSAVWIFQVSDCNFCLSVKCIS